MSPMRYTGCGKLGAAEASENPEGIAGRGCVHRLRSGSSSSVTCSGPTSWGMAGLRSLTTATALKASRVPAKAPTLLTIKSPTSATRPAANAH